MAKRRKKHRPIDGNRLEPAFVAREGGATLREAAAAARVHVATLGRWQNREPWIRQALQDAEDYFWLMRRIEVLSQPAIFSVGRRRPAVPWRGDCPRCGAGVEVRTADGPGGLRFWRCSRWLDCSFVSWRPRAPQDCPRCGGPRFWSHSRKSVACDRA
jgi:hypothetical protein